MKSLLLALLALYRWLISPVLHAVAPGGCKFHPSCSQYATEAIEIHGGLRGGWMALKRLLRCHPFSRGGFDPVPLKASLEVQTSAAGNSSGAFHAQCRDPLP